MSEKNVETEVKMWVASLAAVEARLITAGAKLAAPRVFERNNRYDRRDGSLTADGVVLRLRQDSRGRLTYKEAGTLVDGVMSRFEAEVEISDFDTMALILERLGFVFSFAYEKYRTTYHLDGAEIVLDEMPFGSFVEVEGSHAQIFQALDVLNLKDAPRIRMSYAAAFNALRKHLDLPFSDATFANFETVALPADLLSVFK